MVKKDTLLVFASSCIVLIGSIVYAYKKHFHRKESTTTEESVTTEDSITTQKSTTAQESTTTKKCIRILYASVTGSGKEFALQLEKDIYSLNVNGIHTFDTSVVNMKDYDQDNLEQEDIVVCILSTWTGGVPAKDGVLFCNWVKDMASDFRISKKWLSRVRFAVFGLGNTEYDEDYGTAAIKLDEQLEMLGAKRMLDIGLGDDNVDQKTQFYRYSQDVLACLCSDKSENSTWLPRKQFRKKNKVKDVVEWTEEDRINDEMLMESEDEKDDKEPEPDVVDMEDMAHVMEDAKKAAESKEMITPLQRKALKKEGYKIIGTHSAVKICRWTKHQLRGRGGCYKHTFYGITSYQCMETTPSLACANKCVFCWRHHKNPVGREWRWKVDPPEELIHGAIDRHQKMIKELKGLPGLKMDRWKEAFTVKHCALSLVGEPIMYPHINKFVQMLHEREISTFLVTNAQFPEKIAQLDPLTQLYVSVDASTKESLKQVDRPLFKDFWERFLSCLKQLKLKGQRTVYRMTLVKGYNMNELDGYRELINIGQPDFIEVKGVTYCGKSDGSDLTMKNVPWHEEVRGFSQALCDILDGEYGLAAEHEHSNCVLIARKKFCIDGQWHTWIDYDKFHRLVAQYYKDGTPFVADDYIAPTPYWAMYDAPEGGFDPIETRFRRTKDGTVKLIDYKPTESGCG